MPLKLHDKDALVTHARKADKPVAFLVGCPLSEDASGGVPGVSAILGYVREELQNKAPERLVKFETEIAGKSGTDAYQAALVWLQGYLGQNAVNRVVDRAVRRARVTGAPIAFEDNGEPRHWHLPIGTKQLAELIRSSFQSTENHFPGPILTTNFDPLLVLALEALGVPTTLHIIDEDGKLPRTERRTRYCDVVYLHGFWRGNTLHTLAQLTADCSDLKNSIKKILNQRILIVTAYGGWDDVFTKALTEVAKDDDAQVEVLWCFYETDPNEIELKYRQLLSHINPLIRKGNFHAFGGIDCHSIFADIGGFSPTSTVSNAATTSPLAGWERIDSAYLAGLAPLRQEEIIRYFDGAVPTWRHAVSDSIPRRQAVSEVNSRLAQLQLFKDSCSLQLIRAAGGEGKTTLLLQAAADAAQSGEWSVLWRPSPHIGLAPEHIMRLDTTKQWLIVADDADNLIPDLSECVRLLRDATNVHFLLAARDTDWHAANGDEEGWESRVTYHPEVVLRGLIPEDAKAVVNSWRNYGEAGLKGLAAITDSDKQIQAFLKAIQDDRKDGGDGSLFGGLLAVRFGETGLQAHVREFLTRLRGVRISGSSNSLFDALVYAAACHAVGLPGINENVLGDLVSVPRDWVHTRIVRPLGEEAAAVQNAGHVLTRHSKVAAAVIVEAEQTFNTDLAEVWRAIVRQTVHTGTGALRVGQTFEMIVHAGPRLQKLLPKQFSEDRRKIIAIAAAKAAMEYKTDWLGCIDSLGRTYREAGDFDKATELFRNNLKDAPSKIDFDKVIRAYWYEWSVCEGKKGNGHEHAAANAWLAGLALSDLLNPAPISQKDVKVICCGIGSDFAKLANSSATCPYAKARCAIAWLGSRVKLDARARSVLKGHDRASEKIGIKQPASLGQAIHWLIAGVARARRELNDPYLAQLEKPGQISFRQLKIVLASPAGQSRKRLIKKSRWKSNRGKKHRYR
jgi:tetratricopeptide (TPR) repeat protein